MTDEGGEANLDDADIFLYVTADGADGNLALRHAPVEEKEEKKADKLRERGCHARTENVHAEHTNEEPVSENVEQSSRAETDHGIERFSFIAQIVVEHDGSNHDRTGKQHPKAVFHGVRKRGFGAPQKAHEGLEEAKPEHQNEHAHGSAREECGGDIARSGFGVFVRQGFGNKGSRAVPPHKGECLNDGLQGKENACCRLLAFPRRSEPHKITVRQIVDARDEHGNCCGNPECNDQTRDGCLRHFLIMFFCRCQCSHLTLSIIHPRVPKFCCIL